MKLCYRIIVWYVREIVCFFFFFFAMDGIFLPLGTHRFNLITYFSDGNAIALILIANSK